MPARSSFQCALVMAGEVSVAPQEVVNQTCSAAHPRGQRLQPLPAGLRQRGAGVEDHAQALEEAPRQRVVGFEQGQQHVAAARHVEVDRRLHLAQVAHRLLDQPGRRPALVDVQRAAVAQHHVQVVVAAEGVAPRQPVHQHRLLVLEEAPGLRDHLLVGAQHAVGVDHHLRVAGRARGQQVLGMRVGRDGLEGRAHCRALGRAQQAARRPVRRGSRRRHG